VAGTGAAIMVQTIPKPEICQVKDFNCVQMRASGLRGHYESVLGARAKAKSMTNNLRLHCLSYGALFS